MTNDSARHRGGRPVAGLKQLAIRQVLDRAVPLVDQRLQASTRPFERTDLFRPHADSRRWGWTHFGVFLPDLPAPFRYLNTMTLIGATGTTCFDNDALAALDARHTSTVLSSTACGDQHHYEAYDVTTECRFADDGSALAWADDLRIEVDLPRVRVEADYPSFAARIELTTTTAVSYFVRTPVYDHLSLLAPYQLTLTDADGAHEHAGLGTVEYARCITPQSLIRRVLPDHLKIPVDFFTYQIIDLDPDTQLLLTDVRAAGATACRLAHVRTRDGRAEVFTDVSFEVVEYGEDQVDPWGRTMRVPSRLRWLVRDHNRDLIEVDGSVDAPWRFGHGRGYVSAYSYQGTWNARPVAGTGYIEWVDCE